MSLRLRLILAFMALASLLFVVGAISFSISRQIAHRVDDVRSSRGLDLRSIDLRKVGLEIEGFWEPSGSFVATDVDVLPGVRSPKLRGEIQRIDPGQRTVTLYGVPIHVPEDAEFVDARGEQDRFQDLRPGQRIDVSCRVVDGRWMAHKIKTHNVKPSDKIKGTVFAAEIDGEAPETVEFPGLVVLLAPPRGDAPRSALRRIELATHMVLALQECRAAAHDLVGRPSMRNELEASEELGPDRYPSLTTAERLVLAQQNFEHYLTRSYGDDEAAARSSLPSARWRHTLADRQPTFRDHVHTLEELVHRDVEGARAFLYDVFDPFVQDELLPLVYAYLSEAEESLGDQLRSIASRTHTTTRLALAASAVAAVLALLLGLLIWRSIHGPIRTLHAAALRIGQGHLDTSVDIRSHDEFGVLADAFNKMARDLTTTTVSVSNLESVLDSMAAALIIFDPDGRIINVNRATLRLLGYRREELLAKPFEVISSASPADPKRPILPMSDEGVVAVEERTFLAKDGSQIPVSFSGAALRSPDGPLQGYVCVAQDLSERKHIEERLRRSLSEKELLLREVHHRVKNNMQVISSLIAMQSSSLTDPRTVEKFEDTQNRIRSMALIHEQLYRSSDLGDLDMRAYLELLTSTLVRSYSLPGTVDIELQVEEIAMDVDRALATGMIVNELVTNALRHAFDENGVIRVSLAKDEVGDCVLSVADNGKGMENEADPAQSNSLGVSLVMTLAKQLHGHVSFAGEQGTEVRIVFPPNPSEHAVAS